MSPRQRPVILYAGRLSQEKDLAILFEAFQILRQRGAYQLHIVGDGPLRPQTEHFVRSTEHAVYTGMVPYGERLAEIYASADVLTLPSRHETFGLAILEALASGIPAVAIKQGGPIDLLPARVGTLATPGDPVDFAENGPRAGRQEPRAALSGLRGRAFLVGQDVYEAARHL